MQIKLIAMDLDGTLMLPDHQRVGETTRRALAACRQQGVRLALATGRTLALTEPVQAQLPFLDYIVFSNGAGVWDVQNKKRIHSDPMQLADARQICAYLDSRPVYYEFYALTPGRQRGYLLYFAAAKQSKTRAARVDKCAPQILQGKGLDD